MHHAGESDSDIGNPKTTSMCLKKLLRMHCVHPEQLFVLDEFGKYRGLLPASFMILVYDIIISTVELGVR